MTRPASIVRIDARLVSVCLRFGMTHTDKSPCSSSSCSSSGPLAGRVAVVTGASAGIGAATARELAKQGAKVILNARRAAPLDALVAEIDEAMGVETAQPVVGDCADQTVIDRMLHAAHDRFGKPVDLVVVNAGRGLKGSVLTSDPEPWEEMVRVNLIGAARLMRSAAALMQAHDTDERGVVRGARDIIVLGSTVGRHVSPFSSMYGSTKFAVNSLAEALRRELAPSGIRVSLVEPGVVVSEFQSVAGYEEALVDSFHEKFGPLIEPTDVARSICWMASQPAHVAIGDIVIRPARQDYP